MDLLKFRWRLHAIFYPIMRQLSLLLSISSNVTGRSRCWSAEDEGNCLWTSETMFDEITTCALLSPLSRPGRTIDHSHPDRDRDGVLS